MDAAIHHVSGRDFSGAGINGNELLVERVKNPLPNSSFGSLERYVQVRPAQKDGSFERSVVTIPYDDDDLGWVDPGTIRVFRFDDQLDRFELVQDSGVDVDKRFGYAWVDRPGVYGLIGLPSDPGLLATLQAFRDIESALPEGTQLPALQPDICQLILCNGFQVAGGLPAPGGMAGNACEICLGLQIPSGGIVEKPILKRPLLPGEPPKDPEPPNLASCSLQNGQIAFVSDRDGNSDIWVMNADGSAPHSLTSNDGQNDSPAWSPDGTRLAFSSDRAGSEDIWVMDPDGGNPARLTSDPGSDRDPSWASDGTKIVFSSDRSGTEDIWFMNADGSNETQLTTDASRDREPSWSPDCTLIAFVSDRAGSEDIWTMRGDGSNPQPLTKDVGSNRLPAWSPAGDKIVFMSDRSGDNEIWQMNRDGSAPTRLTTNQASDVTPHWSPDRLRIAFASDRGGSEDIWVMDVNGNTPVRLTTDPGADTAPDWQRICRVRLPKCGVGFGPPSRHAVGTMPVALATARLRGPGQPMDLVTANAGSDSISVLLGDGAGDFAGAVEYPTAGAIPQHLVIADFTGDGNLDIAVSNREPGQPQGRLSFFLGLGDGTFANAVVFDAGGPEPNGLVVVDLNRDGWLDVAMTYMGNDQVGALINDLPNGNQIPIFPGMVPSGGVGPERGVAVMDFNDNGMVDGAVALSGSNGVAVFIDPSPQGAAAAGVYPVGARPMAILAAKFTPSQRFDLATANHGGNSVSILLGIRGGDFSVRSYPTGRQPIDLATLHLNPGGALDLVTADQGGPGSISLLLNDGLGAFQRVAVYEIGAIPSAVVSGDFDNDGRPDVAVASALSDAVLVLRNTTP